MNYQASKHGLALLRFKRKVRINASGIVYLKLYGANLFGVGNSSENRLSWVDKNHHKIMNISDHPEFVKQAKNVTLFAAFCFEYASCMSMPDPANFRTSLPILVDATCNGLQHLAAMVRDFNVGKSVNLVDSDVIQDIYNSVASRVNESLTMDFSIERSFVKKVVMCVPYNLSGHTAAQYFIENFEYNPETNNFKPPADSTKHSPIREISYGELYKISQQVYKAFFTEHPKLKILVQYFREMADLMSLLDCPITWHTPSGLTIHQKYVKFAAVKSLCAINARKISLNVATTSIDRRSQRTALMPNIVHSLDAANIIKALDIFKPNSRDIFTIHDCFASHASNIEHLQMCVKRGFVSLYVHEEFIRKFHTNCISTMCERDPARIKVDPSAGTVYDLETSKSHMIPEMPQMGDLDIEQIIKSRYMVN